MDLIDQVADAFLSARGAALYRYPANDDFYKYHSGAEIESALLNLDPRDLEKDGPESDLRMVRKSQRYSVQVMVICFIQLGISMRKFGEGFYFWLNAFFFVGAIVGIFLWWKAEKCRSELEDDLLSEMKAAGHLVD